MISKYIKYKPKKKEKETEYNHLIITYNNVLN